MKYNPNLEIKPSPLHGLGVFATRDIPKGKSLHQGHFFQDGIQIRSSYVGFYNYSENPNCELKVRQEVLNKKFFAYNLLTAKDDIKKGDELTLKYTWYNPLFPETKDNKGWRPLPDYITLKPDGNHYNLLALKPIKKETIIGVTHCYLNAQRKFIETCLGCFLKESDNPNAELITSNSWDKGNKKIPATYKLRTIKDIKPKEIITIEHILFTS